MLTSAGSGNGLTYQWYQGTSPGGTLIAGAVSSDYTTPTLTATTSYWVKVSNSCGVANSNTAVVTVNVKLTAPASSNAYATAANTRVVHVTWPAVTNATSYRIERRSRIGSVVSSFTTAGTSYDDTVPTTAVTAYLYRVVAVPTASGYTESDPSPTDFALTGTTLFTDDPILAGYLIRGRHINELRAAIDALRYATNSLSPVWSGATVTGSIYSTDVTSLLAPLSAARNALGFSSFAYSGGVATPTAGTYVLAAQLQQIREALR